MDNLFQFDMLKNIKEITHCYTTRLGGVSKDTFASLNMGFNRGDAYENVIENYQRVTKTLDYQLNSWSYRIKYIRMQVMEINEEHLGMGICRESTIKNIDGMMTNKPGIGLTTFYADCVPLFFYDPIHKAIALSHSGWRGTVKKIGLKTLEAMQRKYKTQAKDVLIGIGPAIGKCLLPSI